MLRSKSELIVLRVRDAVQALLDMGRSRAASPPAPMRRAVAPAHEVDVTFDDAAIVALDATFVTADDRQVERLGGR